jgi:TPR repeat protein
MYRHGLGVQQNYEKALELYNTNKAYIKTDMAIESLLEEKSPQSQEEFDKMNIDNLFTYPQDVFRWLEMKSKYTKMI